MLTTIKDVMSLFLHLEINTMSTGILPCESIDIGNFKKNQF